MKQIKNFAIISLLAFCTFLIPQIALANHGHPGHGAHGHGGVRGHGRGQIIHHRPQVIHHHRGPAVRVYHSYNGYYPYYDYYYPGVNINFGRHNCPYRHYGKFGLGFNITL